MICCSHGRHRGFSYDHALGATLDQARAVSCTWAVAVGPATVVLGMNLAHLQRDLLLHCIDLECHGGDKGFALDLALDRK